MGFKLPQFTEASTSNGVPLFGPAPAAIPAEFTEIPYESFSKSDRALAFPRPADWFSSDPAYTTTGGSSGSKRGIAARANLYEGAGDDDEGAFSLVDKSTTSKTRGGPGGAGFGRGGYQRGGARGGRGGPGGAGGARGGYSRGGGYSGRGRGTQVLRGGYGSYSYRGNRWGDQNQKTRTATVQVRSDWQMLEEIEFPRLSKLRLEVDTDEPDEMAQYGFVCEYDKTYDRVSTRQPVPLQVIDRVHYNPTTSDDPVIQEVCQ